MIKNFKIFIIIIFIIFFNIKPLYNKNLNKLKEKYINNELFNIYSILNNDKTIENKLIKNEIFKKAINNFKNKNYLLAINLFTNLYERYNFINALYYSGCCYYLLSYDYNLDQKYTYNAISIFTEFIKKYPYSDKIKKINNILKILNNKIEVKYFNISKNYYDNEDYKSSIVSFYNFIESYPKSDFNKKSIFYILSSQYLRSINSNNLYIKNINLNKFINMYEKLKSKFPNLINIKNINILHNKILKELKNEY